MRTQQNKHFGKEYYSPRSQQSGKTQGGDYKTGYHQPNPSKSSEEETTKKQDQGVKQTHRIPEDSEE